MMRLQGQTALVTGGGRGIGRAIALALAQEGARVIVCARTRPEVEAVVAEIEAAGGQALAAIADVTVSREVDTVVAQGTARFGPLDILVNNAGGVPSELYDETGTINLGSLGPWDEPEATWNRMMASNLTSVFLCTKAVVPPMIARGHGEVVTIGSAMGRTVATYGGSYAVAKTALTAFTQMCAAEAKKHGVRVNLVSPGMVATPGNDRLLSALLPPDSQPPSRESAESVAQAVLYLLCDAPKAMTGQSLDTFAVG